MSPGNPVLNPSLGQTTISFLLGPHADHWQPAIALLGHEISEIFDVVEIIER